MMLAALAKNLTISTAIIFMRFRDRFQCASVIIFMRVRNT